MFLGFILATCFVPGYTGASIPTQWVVLSVLLLPSLWKDGWFHSFCKLGLVFCAYAVGTVVDAQSKYTSVLGLWYVAIWALAFWWGNTRPYLAPLWKGLALGLGVSSAVAIAQTLGYHPVESADGATGLLYNSNVLAASATLVIIALACYRFWWFIPFPAVGLVLAHSRGAFLVLALTAIAKYVHWLAALAILVASALAFNLFLDPSNSDRLQIWGMAIRGFTFFGWGPFAFDDVYFIATRLHGPQMFHMEFVHNDYLQLAFEYGIGSLLVFAIFGAALTRTTMAEWPVFFAFAIYATFWFPLYSPLTAFIGCACAGHLLRRYDPIRDLRFAWRSHLLSWDHTLEFLGGGTRREALPILPRTTNPEA